MDSPDSVYYDEAGIEYGPRIFDIADAEVFILDMVDKINVELFNVSLVETACLISVFQREDLEEALLGDVEAVRGELQSAFNTETTRITALDEEAGSYMKELLERQEHHRARNG